MTTEHRRVTTKISRAPGLRLTLLAIAGVYISQTLVTTVAMQALPALLRVAGLSLQLIGMTSLFMLPWALKFLWAPAVERRRLPSGSRQRRSRSLILAGQALLAAVLFSMALGGTVLGQARGVWLFAALLGVALIAATVDIACDGMTVDLVRGRQRGWGNVAQVGGAYVGVMLGGSGFLFIAHRHGWVAAMAACALAVLLLSLPMAAMREPSRGHAPMPHTPSLHYAWSRPEVRLGLLSTFVFGAGIRMATSIVGPLLIDSGATLEHLAWLLGAFSLIAGLAGTLLGGLLVRGLGAWRAVTMAVGLQAAALCGLALCAERAPLPALAALVGCTFAAMAAGFVAIYSALMALASPMQAGVDFTLFQCADAFVAMLGGIAGGWLAQHCGYGACLSTAALLSLAATAYSLGLRRRFGSSFPVSPSR